MNLKTELSRVEITEHKETIASLDRYIVLSHESLDALITAIDNHTSKLIALAKR